MINPYRIIMALTGSRSVINQYRIIVALTASRGMINPYRIIVALTGSRSVINPYRIMVALTGSCSVINPYRIIVALTASRGMINPYRIIVAMTGSRSLINPQWSMYIQIATSLVLPPLLFSLYLPLFIHISLFLLFRFLWFFFPIFFSLPPSLCLPVCPSVSLILFVPTSCSLTLSLFVPPPLQRARILYQFVLLTRRQNNWCVSKIMQCVSIVQTGLAWKHFCVKQRMGAVHGQHLKCCLISKSLCDLVP